MKSVWVWTAAFALAGCHGNPLNNGGPSSSSGGGGTTVGSASSSITRYEARDDSNGNGYATGITYNSSDDTLTVQNLAFTGDKKFTKDTTLSPVGPYSVYEGPTQYADSTTGTPINQFSYRAIYAKSASGKTAFSIVRTGQYVDYGFGGFMYQRNGGVTLPAHGQANYAGTYEGLMDFNGQSGLYVTTGSMNMAIDFDAFNTSQSGAAVAAIKGSLTNRKIYDLSGNDVTSTWVGYLNSQYSASLSALPVVTFKVGPGVLQSSGYATGSISSSVGSNVYENGTYYVLLAGDNASEAVGILVMTAGYPNDSSIKQRETGGFLVTRQ
jgi:hypothetical protein